MDVKSAFLDGELKEEVYLQQPPGFENLQFPNYCYKLEKAVYGLKQAPRAWYETLSNFLIDSGFKRGIIDPTIFRRSNNKHLMLVHIYVDDIIFGSTNQVMVDNFAKLMTTKFQMSMNREINFFLRDTPSTVASTPCATPRRAITPAAAREPYKTATPAPFLHHTTYSTPSVALHPSHEP